MPRVSDPDYVAGKRPPYKIQPPIVHPAWCVCGRCSELPDLERSKQHVIRIFRVSTYPSSRVHSAAHAIAVKQQLERALQEKLEEAKRTGGRPLTTFRELCEAYRARQRADGKRIDRNEYVIAALERHFGSAVDPTAITKADYKLMVDADRVAGRGPETIGRHTRILIAILNGAVRDGLIPAHQLHGIRRPIVKKQTKPVIFTRRQVKVLLGPAMKKFEAEQAAVIAAYKPATQQRRLTPVPLRGFCLIAYRTLMRPNNNLGLEWTQIAIDEKKGAGIFRLDHHKNVSRGVEVRAPLHHDVVAYLAGRSKTRSKYVHPNPLTGEPYRNIRDHWARLVKIANEILHAEGAEELADARAHFYTWRHTGASHLAESGADPVLIVRMMGDTSLETVRAHYFDSSLEHMQKIMKNWR